MTITAETTLLPAGVFSIGSGKLKSIRTFDRELIGDGLGYLSGSFPDGVTTVDGIPVMATVRVLARSSVAKLDGIVMAEVQSSADGTWVVQGLNASFKYDVVGRKDGFNDVIMANVTPVLE